ncbi:hypothetical protein ACOMHN_031690 [Nucella lapillus]
MHANNSYVQNLKSAKDELLAEKNMKVIIREDKRPQGEHSRRFNKQQSSEIAILMDNEPTATRDIVLRLKDGETERLMFIRREQKTLQADSYQSLHDTLCENDGDPNIIGQRIVLPSTFVGGPRYMHEKQNNVMAYIRKFGCADLFITMTCNPKWTDITENLLPGQAANDRPDITSRVFKLKLRKLMDMIKKGIFGTPRAWLYSIEFKKEDCHMHIF